jgi:hypothetical protein
MPSALQRVQVCCQPELFAALKTLARGRNLSNSAMASELMQMALSLPEMRAEYEKTAEKFGEVKPIPDPRTLPRQQPHYKVDPEGLDRSFQESVEEGMTPTQRAENAAWRGLSEKGKAAEIRELINEERVEKGEATIPAPKDLGVSAEDLELLQKLKKLRALEEAGII